MTIPSFNPASVFHFPSSYHTESKGDASTKSENPHRPLGVKEQGVRLLTEGKFTNNRVRHEKAEKEKLMARFKAEQETVKHLQDKIITLPYVPSDTLEDFAVADMHGHNNMDAIRRDQDSDLMKGFHDFSQTDLCEGFKPANFMFAACDVMIVVNDKGEIGAALAEINSQSYGGTNGVEKEMRNDFMRHYTRIGAQWGAEHKAKSPNDPLLIMFATSVERKGNPPKYMADKMAEATKIAAGVTQSTGLPCPVVSITNALHLQKKEEEKRLDCQKKGETYVPGEFWPLKAAVILGSHPRCVENTSVKVNEHGKQIGEAFGLKINYVMSDRLVRQMETQIGLPRDAYDGYCNITMPEGSEKFHAIARQSQLNEKLRSSNTEFNAYGLEGPVLHKSVERSSPDQTREELAEVLRQACKEASDEEVRNGKSGDIVIKPSSTGGGEGVTLVRRKDLDVLPELFLQIVEPEIRPQAGSSYGFPFTIQSFFKQHEVDDKVIELRVTPHIKEINGKLKMVAGPAVIKTGPVPQGAAAYHEIKVKDKDGKEEVCLVEKLRKSNLAAVKVSEKEKNERDYNARFLKAGCNEKNLADVGVSVEMAKGITKYIAQLLALAVEANISKQGEARVE